MVKRLSEDARRAVLTSAAEEARRRGDRRLGTDHLLLGLLEDPNSVAAWALGVDLQAARAASDELDRTALAAVGIDVDEMAVRTGRSRARGLPPLTSGVREVLKGAVRESSSSGGRRIDARYLLLALLKRDRPDPAAELLAALGVDRAEARARLAGPDARPV